MKKMKTLFVALSCMIATQGFAQSLNWEALKKDQKHMVTIHTGLDYGLVFGIGYSYQLKSNMPVLFNASYSFPSGSTLLDDFKTKIGGQARLYRINNFQFSASVDGIYRRYENDLVCLQNFGSEMNGVIGYYQPHWYVAGEFGFDKAIVTHFKHSTVFREHVYADAKDGWYEPPTGGNFLYGIQTGVSLKQSDITLKIGKVVTQDFKTTPLLPFYLQLGYNFKLDAK